MGKQHNATSLGAPSMMCPVRYLTDDEEVTVYAK